MTESDNVFERTWLDHKGRKVLIHTMSNKWLNRIRKLYSGERRDMIQPIMDEIKRRKKIRAR